jgi:hypothetical protein
MVRTSAPAGTVTSSAAIGDGPERSGADRVMERTLFWPTGPYDDAALALPSPVGAGSVCAHAAHPKKAASAATGRNDPAFIIYHWNSY